MSTGTALTFEQTLAAMTAFLGEYVAISIVDTQPGVIMASIHGVLGRGNYLSLGKEPTAVYFYMRENTGSGFIVSEDAFRGAGRLQDDTVAIDLGPIGVMIEPGPNPPSITPPTFPPNPA